MVDQPQYLTPEGLVNLEKRLKNLKEVRRPQVAERLRQAMDEGGDLNENAEYEDAKNEQAFVEGEIARLEAIVSSAQIIEDTGKKDQVVVGSRVTVIEKGTKEQEVYHLVGSAEANPTEGKISTESPLGKALIGAKVGQKITVKAPDGELVFTIKSID
ncbi:MAG TPA: transcription elongation factor GreA [Phototrophicaceae bacterium]|jgi:transcription elongation factor GreA|nr:transcription elongation factor GreA [Phototrophicaceae bacterium]